MVALVPEIFLVLEDWVEGIHAFSGQQTDISDHPSNASCSESSSGKPNENDFVSWLIVGRNEGIDFSNVFADSGTGKPTSDGIDDTRSSTYTRVIIYNLMHAIGTNSSQSSGKASDIARNLKSTSRNIRYQRGFLETIIADSCQNLKS